MKQATSGKKKAFTHQLSSREHFPRAGDSKTQNLSCLPIRGGSSKIFYGI